MQLHTKLDKYFPKNTLRKIDVSIRPTFVYSKKMLLDRVKYLKNYPNKNRNFKVRYAMKANNHPEIIKILNTQNIYFDASSEYEALELLKSRIPGERISLSSQQPSLQIKKLLTKKVFITATSLNQIGLIIKNKNPNKKLNIGLRVNPGIGSGYNNRTNTGGVNSSFGLWHEYLDQALLLCEKNNLDIEKLHLHIGSGADEKIWGEVMDTAIGLLEKIPTAKTLDIGGGYKIHRFADEKEADMEKIYKVFEEKLSSFENRSSKKINLEIEPGTYLIGHCGVLLTQIVDIVDTGANGHKFIKTNTGMNDIIRPTMYGAQHKIEVINTSKQKDNYIVVGHNCESGDILTPAKGNPEEFETRLINIPKIGDTIVIYDTGAYCRSMSAKGYNSYPGAGEVFI